MSFINCQNKLRNSSKSFLQHAAVLFFIAIAAVPLRAGDMTTPTVSSVEKTQLHYLRAGKPDAIALLAPPPLPDSDEQAADLNEVRAVCHAATRNDITVAESQKNFTVFTFTPAIGNFFQPGKFPKTENFFHIVQSDAEIVTDNAKDFYKRPRPFVIDSSLASGKLEKSFSYPSGHSTESMVLALVLADLFPEKRDGIIAIARSIGWHRVEIARHYPTDIYAGRVLAQAIVREMKKSEKFQKDFVKARAEIAIAQMSATNLRIHSP